MDNGGIPEGWVPPLPTPIGSLKWRRDCLEESLGRCHSENKAFDCGDVGIFCCQRNSGGWNYWWVDSNNFRKIPEINWNELAKQAIKNGYWPDNPKDNL